MITVPIRQACFTCRKTFNNTRSCPECGGDLYDVGKAFKAPRKENTREWRKVRNFVLGGGSYYEGGGTTLPDKRPELLKRPKKRHSCR